MPMFGGLQAQIYNAANSWFSVTLHTERQRLALANAYQYFDQAKKSRSTIHGPFHLAEGKLRGLSSVLGLQGRFR